MKIYPVIHHLNFDLSLDQARLAHEAGADGVFLISHHNANHELPPMALEIKRNTPSMAVGVNFLGMDSAAALAAASLARIDMLWLDNPGLSSRGPDPDGVRFLDRLADLKVEHPEIFAGVAFKYQRPDPIPSAAAALCRTMGLIPTTSGAATGVAPELQKIIDMFGQAGPLAIASGMTCENVAAFVPYLSHILVATGISRDEHHFDFELLSRFVGTVRAAAL